MSDVAQYRGTGKRKTSVARVILAGRRHVVDQRPDFDDYFKRTIHRAGRLAVEGGGGRGDVRRPSVCTAVGPPARQAPFAMRRPRARRGRSRAARPLKREGFLARDARMVERKKAGLKKARKAPQWLSANVAPLARRYFGTDGVRGVVGKDLTPELAERLGRAATIWAGGGAVLVGRDTRASGRELEHAFASGVASAGGQRRAGGHPARRPSHCSRSTSPPSSRLRTTRPSTTASLFDGDGGKLTDAAEEEIEALLDEPPRDEQEGGIDNLEVVGSSYVRHVVEQFGSDLTGLKLAVDCANGAYSSIAPAAFEELGAEVLAIGDKPDGHNINVGCGATDLGSLQQVVTRERRSRGRLRWRRRPHAGRGRAWRGGRR